MSNSFEEKIKRHFPHAEVFSVFMEKIQLSLKDQGFIPHYTLLGNCICRDETNREMVVSQTSYWGQNFELAGLGGYPSSGITGFTAYSQHISKYGKLVLIHGPHIGINSKGELGWMLRTGMDFETTCCGSLRSFVDKILRNPDYEPCFNEIDGEQFLVEKRLMPRKANIIAAKDPLLEATLAIYKIAFESLQSIIRTVNPRVDIAMIGGIMVNTEQGIPDYFVPLNRIIIDVDLKIRELSI